MLYTHPASRTSSSECPQTSSMGRHPHGDGVRGVLFWWVCCVFGFGCMTDARTPAQTNKNRPRDAALRRWRRCRTLGTHFDDVPKIQGAPPPNPNTHIELASKTCVLAYAYSHRICAPVHSWNRCFWGRLPPATRVFANQREGTIERVYVWTES